MVKIDYRFVCSFGRPTKKTVLLLTGFGSGWEGITETACALVSRGCNVLLMSLPGYGSSGNVSEGDLQSMWIQDNFSLEGTWVNLFVAQFLEMHENLEISFVGHSMGGAILAEAATQTHCVAQSLTMVAPSNMVPESWLLPLKFAWSGAWMRMTCRMEWRHLHGVLQPQKSPWQHGRWRQRVVELRRLIHGRPLRSTLQHVRMKYAVIAGGKDRVYSARDYEPLDRLAQKSEGITLTEAPDFHHNPTIPHAIALAGMIVQSL